MGRSCHRAPFMAYLLPAHDPSTELRCVGSGLSFRRRSRFLDPSWPVRGGRAPVVLLLCMGSAPFLAGRASGADLCRIRPAAAPLRSGPATDGHSAERGDEHVGGAGGADGAVGHCRHLDVSVRCVRRSDKRSHRWVEGPECNLGHWERFKVS